MNYTPVIIIGAIICVIALVSTIVIGIDPTDQNYKKSTKKRMVILSAIYVVTFVPALTWTVVYYYFLR
ncbi:hypothetical protein [Alteribacter populi]|uniref:hypothetical protein n=1 Tax=Alteribacter populi TaxID=2011011 RepID=UPI000BBB1695|nr:hypothetical protein [Alteribacter populi]